MGLDVHGFFLGLDVNRVMVLDTLDAVIRVQVFVEGELEDGRASLAVDTNVHQQIGSEFCMPTRLTAKQ